MKKIWMIPALLSLALVACDAKKEEKENTSTTENNMTENPEQFSEIALNKEFETLDGEFISLKNILAKHQGKTVVIDVWASWCPDCIKGFPALRELQNNHQEVVFVFLSLDKTSQKWKDAIEKYSLEGDHYYLEETTKGEFGQSIDLDWIPRYIVVDPAGNIALKRAIVADDETLINTLNSLQTVK